MQANPWEILGVSENDSLEHIDYVYNNLMKVLHPDRSHTLEARNLNMTQDEKNQYLQLVIKAYKTIISRKKQMKYPDYQIDYSIEEDARINPDKSFMESGSLGGGGFNKEKFNKKFDEALERDRSAGMVDAYGRGYGDFDKGKNYSDNGKISLPSYSGDIDTTPSKIFDRPNMKDNRLVEYIPDSFIPGGGLDAYQELGLTNVSNFSMTTSGKGSLGGVDLMSAYGNNYEPWEKTVMRDPKLSAKFADTGNISKKVAQMESDRGMIYDLPIDREMIAAEKARNFALEQQEKLRMVSKNQRDEYYNELNKGRIIDRRG